MNSFEEKLAELVRAYPHLYDRSRREVKDGELHANSWNEIAVTLGQQDPEHCKSVWRNLRHKFTKARKRLIMKNGEEAMDQAPKLYRELCWLNPYLQPRRTDIIMQASEQDVGTIVQGGPFIWIQQDGPPSHYGCQESFAIICKEEFDSEYHVTQSPSCLSTAESESSAPFSTKQTRKRQRGSPEHSDISRIFSELDKCRRLNTLDVHDRYAQTVADFMRGLSRRRCAIFKKRLNDIMYEMELEELDEAVM